jgi:hypothetical protein
MGKINLNRVILGGILAGIVVNVSEFLMHDVVLKAQHEEAFRALGRTMPAGGTTATIWALWGFAWGIAAVWLYAAIRPRFGAGAGTAARAGLTAWFFNYLLGAVTMMNLGLFAFSGVEAVWNLVQAIVATAAGAWLYKEA